jgi:hypothetical protein
MVSQLVIHFFLVSIFDFHFTKLNLLGRPAASYKFLDHRSTEISPFHFQANYIQIYKVEFELAGYEYVLLFPTFKHIWH